MNSQCTTLLAGLPPPGPHAVHAAMRRFRHVCGQRGNLVASYVELRRVPVCRPAANLAV
jgi:hypothetical protein